MGIAQGGKVLVGGDKVAIQGLQPSGMSAQGKGIWYKNLWKLINRTNSPQPPVFSSSAVMTTPPIDTTGANLLVMSMCMYLNPAGSFSDSAGNTWLLAVNYSYGTAPNIVDQTIYYCINPITSTNHTFTITAPSVSTIEVQAFNYPGTILIDKNSGISNNTVVVPSLQVPAITPVRGNSLIITNCVNGSGPILSVDSGFQTTVIIPRGGLTLGLGAAYLIQTAAQSISPTWAFDTSLFPTSPGSIAVMANFVSSS